MRVRSRSYTVIVACLAGLAVPGLCAQTAASNPLFEPQGAADPGMVFHGPGSFSVISTGGNRDRGAGPIRRSTDGGVRWTETGPGFEQLGSAGAPRLFDADPAGSSMNYPPWALDRDTPGAQATISAPQVYYFSSIERYVAYFTATNKGLGNARCIGRAVASTSGRATANMDNFKADAEPLLCHDKDARGGAYDIIDVSIFYDPQGDPQPRHYILFKRDNPQSRQIAIRPISIDGARVGFDRQRTILTPTEPWEDGSVEAPKMIFREDNKRYYLFYSGSNFKVEAYAVGVAVSPYGVTYPMGGDFLKPPSAKGPTGKPLLWGGNDPKFCGVGGADLLLATPPGETSATAAKHFYAFYHAYKQAPGTPAQTGFCTDKNGGDDTRYLMRDRLNFDVSGGYPTSSSFWPSVNDGTPSG